MADNNSITLDPLDDAVDLKDLDYNATLDPDSFLIEDKDEMDISGSAPDPESDDDVLAAASEVGIGSDNEEVVRELDIAGDVELAEKLRRGID